MRYAIIKKSVVVNVIEAEAEFAKSINAIEIPNDYGIGDKYVDGVWEYGDRPEPEHSVTQIVQPSEMDILKAQNKALSDRLEFTEDLIAEMAMKVYAE